jgi:GTP-binding protein
MTNFIDECRVHVRAGDGGDGCSSFRREKYVPRGGPDGGNGGRGGSVIFRADAQLTTLHDVHYRQHYRAGRGVHGKGSDKHGRAGADTRVALPLGTLVRDDATGALLCELLRDGETWVAARGGEGGRGNICFATSTNRAPTRADPGAPGEERWLRLELKVLADVGLVGFPNAGKSTLVARVSAARPRIASYPFTTLQPHLGMVSVGDARFAIADIPGLIPGAHRGAGLGDRFLRHVERTRVLVHLLDPEPQLRGEPARSLASDYEALRKELEAYAGQLAARAELVCVSKADLVPDPARRAELGAALGARGLDPRWISAATGEGIEALVQELARRLAAG